MSKVFALRGNVYPSTLEQVVLVGDKTTGQSIRGETAIRESTVKSKGFILNPQIAGRCRKHY